MHNKVYLHCGEDLIQTLIRESKAETQNENDKANETSCEASIAGVTCNGRRKSEKQGQARTKERERASKKYLL